MKRTTDTMASTKPSRNSVTRSLWSFGWFVFIVVILVAVADYAKFDYHDRRALEVVSQLGGRAGSLGGWPLGKEYCISFRRVLTDDELQQLAILNSLPGRHYVYICFGDCQISESRLAEIREVLPRCSVHCSQASGE